MGGTDDPSNLIELSVLEHAQAHLTLYEKYGKMEDLLAYKSLSNQMDEERQRAKAILGGRTSKNNHIERDEKWKKNLSKAHKGKHANLNKYKTPEEQKKRSLLGNLKRWGRRDILDPAGPKIPMGIEYS